MGFKSALSFHCKCAIAISGAIGIYMQIAESTDPLGTLSYFTTLSNLYCILLCVVFSEMILFGKNLASNTYYIIKGGAVFMILITHIVFHYILYPDFRKNPEFKMDYGIFAAHYIVPLGMLADYILFDEKGHFNYSNVFLWVFIPVLFIPFAYTKTYVSGMFDKHFQHKYPYFFMDYEKLGVKTVVLIISAILVFFVLFAYLFVFIDKLLGKIKKTKIE